MTNEHYMPKYTSQIGPSLSVTSENISDLLNQVIWLYFTIHLDESTCLTVCWKLAILDLFLAVYLIKNPYCI